MRKVMYRIEMTDGTRLTTPSFKLATSEGVKILETILVPWDGLTDKQREEQEKRYKEILKKFRNKPRA